MECSLPQPNEISSNAVESFVRPCTPPREQSIVVSLIILFKSQHKENWHSIHTVHKNTVPNKRGF